MDAPFAPSTPPPPECWGWEIEYLIARLSDRLDIWKSYGCLLVSLDLFHLLPRQSQQFTECLQVGSHALCTYLSKKYLCNTNAPLSVFQTPTMNAMCQACCVDDSNLSNAFDLLRLAEILENCSAPLPQQQQAKVVCAVVGELELVARNLLQVTTDENQKSKMQCCQLLRATSTQLLDLLAELGRDRAAFMRCHFANRAVAGLRPKFCDASQLNAFRSDSSIPIKDKTLSIYDYENNGDRSLYKFLMCGSLSSIWHRMNQLWALLDTTSLPMSNLSDAILRGSTIADSIRYAIFHATLNMTRFRKLIFTRFLEALCSPTILIPPSHLTDSPPQTSISSPKALVSLVVTAFLDTNINDWPYETEEQLRTFERSSNLSKDQRQRLLRMICVPDSMSFASTIEEGTLHGQRFQPKLFMDFAAPYFQREKFSRAMQMYFDERKEDLV